ncbi:PaaI family thioesterase [Flavisphingomonas formosensis]|uniref:PaaI family thioesterase n=1 Tax=Flavisphingomonas formosensis TaxID=861534 RepID=UPI0012FA1464|nr:PaaI family thioesterase [Sphingomonas formosensis]
MAGVGVEWRRDIGEEPGPPADRIWRDYERGGPFTDFTGPFYTTREALLPGERVRLGFRVGREHCNPRMVCHGGMLATFFDIVLAGGLIAEGAPSPVITISMTLDYLAPAYFGEWIESRVEVPRLTHRIGFPQAMLVGPQGPVLRGSGVFKLQPKRVERA